VLATEGCTEMQGYLIGRPEPIDKYSRLLGRASDAKAPECGGLTAA
jgi:EAL domain-containing protein (putative c-di-GMP-specific phosphodiesterase class I)